ncbi:hypothetical protein [Virgisporangium aurantiacum]|uniref:Secreted protein n=1 Tax=Virgisporangium aurantiacum TaxID=175570 RepID=A0A8J3ZH59_9ACTN|nr:hypothetical protein [Virgisporangium aurantiacum]GIJ64099.1 hypothetical protein Vau01_116150 [Virgisporangium aurantiacum]
MRMIPKLLVGGALAVAGTMAVPTAAQAAPTGCSLTISGRTAQVVCSGGSGQVRAAVECLVMKPGDPFSTNRFGPWVGVGAVSSVSCGGGTHLVDAWYETRN